MGDTVLCPILLRRGVKRSRPRHGEEDSCPSLKPFPWRAWEAGLDRFWQSIFGSPDLGAVDFKTLTRRKTPNDALTCPQDFCPNAKPDDEPPVFSLPATRLRVIVSEVVLSQPNTSLLETSAEQDRFLVRTKLMRYPDTVVAQVIALDEGHSTLALYSRSQIGRSDFGVNRRRIERWLAALGMVAAREQSHAR
ncbi:DUF1499 domain-containing protein [Microvirga sp. KLBC 81]|uniref:DUF1499 domain-containing protein n=1 Tax=Microvirga sp. KLBC 81 TaxID=1862707 RepID=UPI001402360B|nr:DUF1499 domain-containing protein [Microvirga sp. KLBC 81]